MRNDHWTVDLAPLGRKRTGNQLAELILTCHPPYAICVQGKWGAGKTSLLRYAMARLGGEPIGLGLGGRDSPVKDLPAWTQKDWQNLKEDTDDYIVEKLKDRVDYAGTENRDSPDLEPEDVMVLPIWFNPWQHQGSLDLAVALLQEIRAPSH